MPAYTLAKIMERSTPEPNSGCWLFLGSVTKEGYGRFDSRVLAHRTAYECVHGPIPRGMRVCHRCDTPSCVNPDHLFAGTPLDNMVDMVQKGRQRNQADVKPHLVNGRCHKGHVLEPRNAIGKRICRTCRNEQQRRFQARRKSKAGAA